MKTTEKSESVREKTVTGVIHTPDGSIICARLTNKNGSPEPAAVIQWPASNVFKTALTLSRGAVCGLYTEWRRTAAPNPSFEPPASGVSGVFTPYLHTRGASVIPEALSGCITSAVTEDSYLLTLPLAFCKEPPSSFLSVYHENGIVTFGVVTERKLEAVFSFPCASASLTEAAAGRVKRYWKHVLKRSDFPREAFIFNDDGQSGPYDGMEARILALPRELYSLETMRAAGAGLTALYPAPAFEAPREHSFRIHRPILLKAAAVLLCVSLLAALIPAAANFHAGRSLSRSEKIYSLKLNENRSLRELEKTAGELSAKVFSIKKTYDQSSRWGSFLRLLAEIRPRDLFLERLGSDRAQGDGNKMRIALNGWAQSENSVTEFIAGLQASNYIDGVSLVSMERDAKNGNICKFRILCVTQLLKD